jgi:hypothetical protein
MTNEEVIKKLESVPLPDISQERHGRELRAALLREYAQVQIHDEQKGLFRWLQSRPPLWRTILITSTAWALVVLLVVLSVLIPTYQSHSVEAMAVDAVMANEEVRSALANDEMATVKVTDIGNRQLEVVVESRGDRIIVARVNTLNNAPIITKISYIMFFGSIYDVEEQLTGKERDKVISLASTDRTFRELLDKGAVISKIMAIQSIVATRHLDTGETTETKERWATIHLEFQGKRGYFVVDPENGRVINRSANLIP